MKKKSLLIILLVTLFTVTISAAVFSEAPAFRNGEDCPSPPPPGTLAGSQSSSTIHIAMTLDSTYIRGSIAGIFSVLRHATCPQNIIFHFITTTTAKIHPRHHHHQDLLHKTITTTFPYLTFHFYRFDSNLVKGKISYSIRSALDQPLNYARIYLADLLPSTVKRVIYFDSDLIVVDDVAKLWGINLNNHVLGAPEYCHANLTNYFTVNFWSNPSFITASFNNSKNKSNSNKKKPCYFNTGVMVIDLFKWRQGKYTVKLDNWMKVQKRCRIYELGSLPPFLLVFGGDVERVEHRWNQHGLGGDNLQGLCRELHPGPVSLLHWSGKGKPWLRLDSKKPCPLDLLWAPYDLFVQSHSLADS
ncbi:hypothetical protein ACFE04_017165 [Oxalis oulophora]